MTRAANHENPTTIKITTFFWQIKKITMFLSQKIFCVDLTMTSMLWPILTQLPVSLVLAHQPMPSTVWWSQARPATTLRPCVDSIPVNTVSLVIQLRGGEQLLSFTSNLWIFAFRDSSLNYKKLCYGWWWSSGQHACPLLWRSVFESRWRLQFFL